MEVFLYSLIFIMGTVIGSFCTLAVYRIPLKKDITHERSFCPNCGHRLEFLDLIPILSYIFLRGKCRYCKKKIRIRYLFLEVFSGVLTVLFALSFNFNFTNIEVNKYIYFFFGIMFLTGTILIASIGKETGKASIPILIFNACVILAYILYLSIIRKFSMDRYAIYLFCVFAISSICAYAVILFGRHIKKREEGSEK